ncbi:hypothetical protein APY04_3443 [Hyphomicrobium sulfonivorans]|uniref:Uncharacterized protein n=1 Tax=Hyphomicrobium sulfonivorans TaxID=121290 RepID=A0A109B8T1_HYPSL|nr:hypothetical protein [Hyphomicrobium sulfonivorans]KWT64179.1 hypothetical protein APY04_3443 [Hyphomicrobium sulfonivorans]
MATTFDLSDVPASNAADLAAAMRSLIETGHGLVLLNGATDTDLDAARATLQRRLRADPQQALAAFLRFRHLVAVFGARRLHRMMLQNGYTLMAPSIAIAANMRLNSKRGFNPQRFLLALNEALNGNIVPFGARALLPGDAHPNLAAA